MRGIISKYRLAKAGMCDLEDKSKAEPLEHCIGVDGPCVNQGLWRRRNTAYEDDSENWVFMCDECFIHEQGYWEDMWSELKCF